jgi:hypothetical protein
MSRRQFGRRADTTPLHVCIDAMDDAVIFASVAGRYTRVHYLAESDDDADAKLRADTQCEIVGSYDGYRVLCARGDVGHDRPPVPLVAW